MMIIDKHAINSSIDLPFLLNWARNLLLMKWTINKGAWQKSTNNIMRILNLVIILLAACARSIFDFHMHSI